MTVISGGPVSVSASAWSAVIPLSAVPAGSSTVTFTYTNTTAGAGPHGGIGFLAQFFFSDGSSAGYTPVANVGDGSSSSISNFAVPSLASSFNVSATPGPAANTNTASASADFNNTGSYCEYGTRAKSSTVKGVLITAGLITAMADFLAIPAIVVIGLDTFVGVTLWTDILCSGPPPAFPVFTESDFLPGLTGVPAPSSVPKWWQGLQAIAWPYFCECTPGSPAPTSYPSPVITVPPDGPAGPALISCDTDLCGTLNELARMIAAINAQVLSIRSQVDLIQRVRAPFAYIPGAIHSGLTGAGQFAVQGILGLAIDVTSLPPSAGEEAGDPIARFGLGWITTGTSDGWRRSTPIRHNPAWVEVEPDDTLIGYSLEPLVVATIQEFAREP